MSQLYIGLMSGTSLDAIDSVLAEIDGGQCRLIAAYNHPWPDTLRSQLLKLCSNPETSLLQLGQLHTACGQQFADAALQLLKQANIRTSEISAIGSHGQTIFHAPGGALPFSLQIGNPSLIAEQTGITTVADFRSRDIAAGGEGAPLVPAFHNALFRNDKRNRIILNIGGIANITWLPSDRQQPVIGFDTGPGNLLMDGWAERHLRRPMDQGGEWARSGEVEPRLLEHLLAHDFFKLAAPKSTGREMFNLDWLDQTLSALEAVPAAKNIQATLCQLTSRTISDEVIKAAPAGSELLVCGGGVHNATLMNTLRNRLGDYSVTTTAAYGVDPDWVEGVAFAWLAAQTLNGAAGNLPSVTGAHHPVILGGIYPGNEPTKA